MSHRAGVLERVDRILVLDQGRIVASGNHDTLLQNSPLYRETWELQQHDREGVLS